MSLLDGILSPLLTQTANARGAYLSGERQAQEKGITNALAQLKAKREAESASITDALHKAQTQKALQPIPEGMQLAIAPDGTPYVFGKRTGSLRTGEVTSPQTPPSKSMSPLSGGSVTDALTRTAGPSSEVVDQGAPAGVSQAPPQAPAQAPAQAPTQAPKPFAKPAPHIDPLSREGIQAAVSLDSAKQVHKTPPVHAQNFVDPQGGVHLATDAEALTHKDWTKQTAAANTGSAMANRQKDYVALMVDALPRVRELSPTINATAVWGLLKHPNVTGFVPGVTDDDKEYAFKMRDFIAGALHEESGARLSDAQLAWGIPRFAVSPNDSPAIRAKKIAAMESLVANRAQNANYVIPGSPLSAEAQKRLSPTQNRRSTDATGDAEFDALMAKVKKVPTP